MVLPLVNISHVQSGYFYITQTLSKLTKLKCLEITSKITPYINFNIKGIKSLNKGLLNFLGSKGNLTSIKFSNLYANGNQNEIIDKFFTPIAQMLKLE